MPADQARSETAEVPPVTGYRLILPDEWDQIPLRHGTEQAVRRILDEAFSRIPPGSPEDKVGPYKRDLERRFRSTVRRAQEGKALDLYLPVRSAHNVNLGASIIVSESCLPIHRENATQSDPTDVAVQLLSTAGTDEADLSSGELDGALAVRREHIAGSDPDHGAGTSSRRVEYVVSVPDEPNRWFAAAFSTIGGGDPRDELADALVDWFDAVMMTFRWRRG